MLDSLKTTAWSFGAIALDFLNILPDLGANRTFSIPTPSAAGVWYRFIYGGAAADTDNHIIDTEMDAYNDSFNYHSRWGI